MFLWFLVCRRLVTWVSSSLVELFLWKPHGRESSADFLSASQAGFSAESLGRSGIVATASLKILVQSVLCSYNVYVESPVVIPKLSVGIGCMKLMWMQYERDEIPR